MITVTGDQRLGASGGRGSWRWRKTLSNHWAQKLNENFRYEEHSIAESRSCDDNIRWSGVVVGAEWWARPMIEAVIGPRS